MRGPWPTEQTFRNTPSPPAPLTSSPPNRPKAGDSGERRRIDRNADSGRREGSCRGAGGSHAELGHHVIDPSSPRCACGARGCWESLASGPAMAAWMRDHPYQSWF
ncbi:MAG: ROK family protein [Acidobacteria bacterium]|nr:ROK family protein [Acidobacteriota bacterium]